MFSNESEKNVVQVAPPAGAGGAGRILSASQLNKYFYEPEKISGFEEYFF